MARKISNTIELMKSSWHILKDDKQLLLFPLMSGICLSLVTVSFLIPLLLDPNIRHLLMSDSSSSTTTSTSVSALQYALLFLFYFCNYFVVTFFNTGLISCAIRRMHGENTTFTSGLWDALQRLHQIAGWSFIAASVGVIIQLIENKSDIIGKIVASILGMSFSIASFFVIPIMVTENKSPFAALSESKSLFFKSWGEQFIAYTCFGLILCLFWIPGVALFVIGFNLKSILCIVIATLYCIVMLLTQAALHAVFQAALFYYCKNGKTPMNFDATAMQMAFKVA